MQGKILTTYAIIPAGGIGARMAADRPKQFLEIAGIPLLVHTLRAFERAAAIAAIIVVVPTAYVDESRDMLRRYPMTKVKEVVAGGRLRQDSVAQGLARVPEDCDLVAVHDGARPLVSPSLIDACVVQARRTGAAMAAVPVNDTLKEVGSTGAILRTVDRTDLWRAQTPQVVRTELLRQALALAVRQQFVGTDEASLLELLGHKMVVVNGSEKNIKITHPADLALAEALVRESAMANQDDSSAAWRMGHGYDAHALVVGRPLILGGVNIPHDLGLLGHSDADVLTHALCDALLGSLGLGDIGGHFPDTDSTWKGVSSLLLLGRVMELVAEKGYVLANADVTVLAQAPKLAPYWSQMRQNLAQICGVEVEQINLKGTTTEKMGFVGRQEGIAAHAVVGMKRL